jgi:hypothetical protein
MKQEMTRFVDGCRRAVFALACVGAGLLAGSALAPPSAAVAEGQPAAPQQHLMSGGQLSVPLLKEIAATLHQMDARIARIETIAQQVRGQKAPASPMQIK